MVGGGGRFRARATTRQDSRSAPRRTVRTSKCTDVAWMVGAAGAEYRIRQSRAFAPYPSASTRKTERANLPTWLGWLVRQVQSTCYDKAGHPLRTHQKDRTSDRLWMYGAAGAEYGIRQGRTAAPYPPEGPSGWVLRHDEISRARPMAGA
jgi:hypothetical protein